MANPLEGVRVPGRRDDEATLSPRRRRTRLRLLRAAVAVFSRKSVPEATVEEVLREADVSRRTFYQFFSDKVDLLAALYADSVNHLHRRRIEATEGATDGLDLLLRGFSVYSDLHATAASIMRVLASEALRPDSPLGPMREALIDRTVELYCEGFAALEGRALDPLEVRALVLMSEALNLHMVTTTSATPADIGRVRDVVHRLVRRAVETD